MPVCVSYAAAAISHLTTCKLLAAAPERQNQTLACKLRQYKKVICKKKKEDEGKESLWRKDSLSVEMTYDGAFFNI